jgi:hypothetical protein
VEALMKHFFYLLLLVFLSFKINASDIISENILSTAIIINPGQTQTISTGRSYYIDHLIVNAEGVMNDSTVEVLVNGTVKGTIYAPGRDPEYVVTVREVTNHIEIRYKTGGKMKISSLTIFRSEDGYEPGSIGHLPVGKEISTYIASSLIDLCRKLEHLLPTSDFEKHILPVKIVAGQLYAVASAHGDVSLKTMEKLQALNFAISLSVNYIDELLKNGKTFELAVKYLELKEQLKEALDL